MSELSRIVWIKMIRSDEIVALFEKRPLCFFAEFLDPHFQFLRSLW